MKKIATLVILIVLVSAVGGCSKCEIPDLVPKFCRTGPPPAH